MCVCSTSLLCVYVIYINVHVRACAHVFVCALCVCVCAYPPGVLRYIHSHGNAGQVLDDSSQVVAIVLEILVLGREGE